MLEKWSKSKYGERSSIAKMRKLPHLLFRTPVPENELPLLNTQVDRKPILWCNFVEIPSDADLAGAGGGV